MSFVPLPPSALTEAIKFTPAFLFECAILSPRGRASESGFARLDKFRAATKSPGDPIDTVIALAEVDVAAAAELVDARYAKRGYFIGQAGEIREGDEEDSDYCFPILVRAGETVLGTVTLGLDSPNGLLVDEGNQHETDALRADGRRLTELVRLAVVEGAQSRRTLAALFNSAYGIACAHGATDVLIEVNPRHVRFYERSFGFEVIGHERVCPRVGAPSVLLRLEAAKLAGRIGQLRKLLAEMPLQ